MELSVLTFNIRYDTAHDGPRRWEHRRDLVLAILEQSGADVIGFQEVLPHQRHDLQERLSGYRMVGRGREHDGGGEQCCLAFKPSIQLLDWETFWLSPTPEQPGSVGWDAMLTRICTRADMSYQGQPFTLFNAHFDHHGKEAPVQSAQLLLERANRLDHPHLVMGDFNSTPDSAPLKLLGVGLRDSLAVCRPGDQRGTYHEYATLAQPTRIDYLMASAHWRILDCDILEQQDAASASDHFAVQGRFALAAPGQDEPRKTMNDLI